MDSPIPKMRAAVRRHKEGISIIMSVCGVTRRQARQAFDDALVQLMTTKKETDTVWQHWDVAFLAVLKLTQAAFSRALVKEGLVNERYAKLCVGVLVQRTCQRRAEAHPGLMNPQEAVASTN